MHKARLSETLRHIGARTILLALLVLSITIGSATFIGLRVYSTKKQVLQQQGEMIAKEAAMEYTRYLHTHENIVRLVTFTVDSFISGGESNAEIERYLTDQTTYLLATIAQDSTGLYGWINGEYLDGAGWVPDGDYVATERPWYTQAVSSGQKVTFVEPYLDANTGTIMITVSGLLDDGRSVIALDVSLNAIQKIVERISSTTEGSQAFVIDESGIVVAHSSADQIGRNYLRESDSVGNVAAKMLLNEGQLKFDVDTADGNYSVYADALDGGWYSVSLINADIWYGPLKWTITLFAIVLGLILTFIVIAFIRLSAKNLALQNLHNRITQEEKRGEELKMLSETDRMTGLFDRVSGKRRVDKWLKSSVGGMFLEMDIDHFKMINDTYGHQTGDEVILALTKALKDTFRTNDITMRLGGDEFGVFAIGITNRKNGEALIERLFKVVDAADIPQLHGKKYCISVGAALCSRVGKMTFEELYARADEALYLSKKENGNFVTFN